MLGKMLSIVLTGAALLSGSKNAVLPEKDIGGTIFLVNRQHVISEQYVPEPLRKTQVYGMSQSMREDAATALEELFQAAQAGGLKLAAQTGDVDRERVFVDKAIRLPELFHERLAADDAALALKERLQDAVVVFRQLDALPLIRQHPPC